MNIGGRKNKRVGRRYKSEGSNYHIEASLSDSCCLRDFVADKKPKIKITKLISIFAIS
jgi:hypothetical protein